MKKSFKQWNEYRADFLFISFASILALIIGLINIEIIYTQVDSILGWSKFEVLWMVGYFYIVKCIFNTFFINFIDIGYWVHSGMLDLLKVRPLPVIFQLLFSERYNTEFPIDELVIGIVLLISSGLKLNIQFTNRTIIYFIVTLILSVVIYTCMVFIISSISLWTVRSNYFIEFIFELEEINQYPINVYGSGIFFLLTYIIPMGFVSFYPNQLLLGHQEFSNYAIWTPIVAILLMIISIIVWKKGIKNYQSPNS